MFISIAGIAIVVGLLAFLFMFNDWVRYKKKY